MFIMYNNRLLFYRIHSMTLRTAQALYTLALLKLLRTILMITHWDSINMTGKFYIIKNNHSMVTHLDLRSKSNSIVEPGSGETVYISNNRE